MTPLRPAAPDDSGAMYGRVPLSAAVRECARAYTRAMLESARPIIHAGRMGGGQHLREREGHGARARSISHAAHLDDRREAPLGDLHGHSPVTMRLEDAKDARRAPLRREHADDAPERLRANASLDEQPPLRLGLVFSLTRYDRHAPRVPSRRQPLRACSRSAWRSP